MKVLLQSYNTCCQNLTGGVNIRIRRIYSELRKLGIEVDFFDTFNTKLEEYDVLHVFRLDAENAQLIECAKQRGLKIVISAVMNLCGGRKIDIYRGVVNRLPIMTTYKLMFKALNLADCVVAETLSEKKFLCKHYKISEDKVIVIPNGVEENDYYDGKDVFNQIGYSGKYLLHVGRFDNNKNQLSVIKALKNTGVHVVFVGGPDHSEHGYYDRCVAEANGSSYFHFLGWLPPDSTLLKSAYQHAYAFILPSFHETFGLVLLEAGICGAKLLISNTLPILDYEVFHDCLTFDPADTDDIRRQVEKAMQTETSRAFINKIQLTFSWDSVAKQHVELYRSLCDENAQKNTCSC